MSRRNRMIVRKIRNIVILLMAIIVMIGAYKNIRDSRAEDVIEINAIAIDNYGYLSNELFKLDATQIGEDVYEIQLPESVNGKEVNRIVKVTLEEPVPEVEIESGLQENASTENELETIPDTTTNNNETEEIEEIEDTTETEEKTDSDTATEEQAPEATIPQEDTTQILEEAPTQIPTEPVVENKLEIIDNKIILTKEQIDTKQLNIEVSYNVAILEKTEQGEISKNILSEKTEEERQKIEITEETEMLYSKILKYEDEENQKLVEVKGFLPKDAELKIEEVSQEQLTEIFGDATIDVAYDIKIVRHVTKEILIDKEDPTKGTTEMIETVEVNPEEFGETCEVSIKDTKIKTESKVYHVKKNNTYESVPVKENTEENITFDANTFSIYAVTTDEDIMLSDLITHIDLGHVYGGNDTWEQTVTERVEVISDHPGISFDYANAKFTWRTTQTSGGSNPYENRDSLSSSNSVFREAWFEYTSNIEREGVYYLGYTVEARLNGDSVPYEFNHYSGPWYIDYKAPTYSSVEVKNVSRDRI